MRLYRFPLTQYLKSNIVLIHNKFSRLQLVKYTMSMKILNFTFNYGAYPEYAQYTTSVDIQHPISGYIVSTIMLSIVAQQLFTKT